MKRFHTDANFVLMLILILGQRIAIPVADYQIAIALLAFYVFIVFWAFNKQIVIQTHRLVYFLPVLLGTIISTWFAANYSPNFSLPSVLLLLMIYFPSILVFRQNCHTDILNGFQAIMFVFALVGILQFLVQVAGFPNWDWLSFIPRENIIANYNYSIPISAQSAIQKSNGVFFQEPSIFSQFIALSIIIEVYAFRRYVRLPFLMSALLASFSGTGLILLAAGMLSMITNLKLRRLFIFFSVSAAIFAVFLYTGFASYTLNRIGELNNPRASGYIRFVAPYTAYLDFVQSEEGGGHKIFGLGPGTSDGYDWKTVTYFNSLTKLLVEYGFFGASFFAFLAYIFFSRQAFWLAFPSFIMYTFLAGYLLTPQITVCFFPLLWLHQNKNLAEISPGQYG